MKIHELKTYKEYFALVKSGVKQFEIRIDDRDFEIGDELILREWDKENLVYTGRFIHRKVDYLLKGGQFGLADEYVVMSISKI
jgi:ASC-1-like (ASCH) protein